MKRAKKYHPNHPHIDGRNVVIGSDYDALAADNQRLREAIESAESLFPLSIDAQKFWFDGREIKADGDDRFYSAKKVEAFLSGIHAALVGSKGGE